MNFQQLFRRFLLWRIKYLSNRNFILIISFLVGICGGLAAVVMKTSVHYVQQLLTLGVAQHYHNYLYFFYPLIGILLTVIFKITVLKENEGHGIGNLLFNISRRSSLIDKKEMYSNIVGSSLTVGFGGSVGLEAPIVTTGAAIGSNLGRLFHFGYKKRTLLIGCGVAAGIGGIFNAPIAGVIFCLEVLLLEFNVPAFIPLLIASVTGTIVSKYILGDNILFNFSLTDAFYFREIPLYLLLGIFTGLLSIYFLRMNDKARGFIETINGNFKRAVWGGIFLGILIFLIPPLYGEGYNVLKGLINGESFNIQAESYFFTNVRSEWFLLLFVGAILAMKVIASAVTLGAGGFGGTFAPSLVSGGVAGYFVAHLINVLDILPFHLSEASFILVGMAGMMSGILHAPLTALFLIAEITNGYMLILPLMLVSAISYATSSFFEPHSVYIKQLAQKGHVHTLDKDRTVLTLLKLNQLLEKDLIPVNVEGKLRDLIEAVSRSKRNIFPVLDSNDHLEGIINLDDIRTIMFKPELYDTLTVRELMHPPKAYINYNESMEDVMQKFDQTGDWNLPVISKDRRFIGMLSKSKIFSHYRQLLKKQAKEDTEIIE